MQNGLGWIAEHRDQQRQRRQRFFAAREQQDILQALARRLRDDVDARLAGAVRLAKPHLAGAAAEERLEGHGEMRVDEVERFLEFLPRDLIELGDGELRVLDRLHQIVALAPQEILALLALLDIPRAPSC